MKFERNSLLSLRNLLMEELSKTKESEIISTVSNPLALLKPLKSLARRFLPLRLRLFLSNWISLLLRFNLATQHYLVSPSEKKEFRLFRLCFKKTIQKFLTSIFLGKIGQKFISL